MNRNELITRREEIEVVMSNLAAQAKRAAAEGDTNSVEITTDTYLVYKDKLAAINKQLGE